MTTTQPKVALITGITGQDGSYLAEFLLQKGYIVHGIKRRASLFNTQRVDHIYQDPHIKDAHFKLHYGDLSDTSNLVRIVQETQPDEIYNLGAQSHVAVSFESPEYTADVDAMLRAGLTPGRELSLVGYDNTEEQFPIPGHRPILTTINNPFERVGRRMAELLMNQVLHGQTAIIHERVPVSLVVRQTTGPVFN